MEEIILYIHCSYLFLDAACHIVTVADYVAHRTMAPTLIGNVCTILLKQYRIFAPILTCKYSWKQAFLGGLRNWFLFHIYLHVSLPESYLHPVNLGLRGGTKGRNNIFLNRTCQNMRDSMVWWWGERGRDAKYKILPFIGKFLIKY